MVGKTGSKVVLRITAPNSRMEGGNYITAILPLLMMSDTVDSNEIEEDNKENTITPTPSTPSPLPSTIRTLHKPMGIVFEPLYNPQNVHIRIKSLPVGGDTLSWILKIRDILPSVDDESNRDKSFAEIMWLLERAENSSNARLLFCKPIANDVIGKDIKLNLSKPMSSI